MGLIFRQAKGDRPHLEVEHDQHNKTIEFRFVGDTYHLPLWQRLWTCWLVLWSSRFDVAATMDEDQALHLCKDLSQEIQRGKLLQQPKPSYISSLRRAIRKGTGSGKEVTKPESNPEGVDTFS